MSPVSIVRQVNMQNRHQYSDAPWPGKDERVSVTIWGARIAEALRHPQESPRKGVSCTPKGWPPDGGLQQLDFHSAPTSAKEAKGVIRKPGAFLCTFTHSLPLGGVWSRSHGWGDPDSNWWLLMSHLESPCTAHRSHLGTCWEMRHWVLLPTRLVGSATPAACFPVWAYDWARLH